MKIIKVICGGLFIASLIGCAGIQKEYNRATAGFLKGLFNELKRPNLELLNINQTSISFQISSGGIDGVRSYRIYRNGALVTTIMKNTSGVEFTDNQLIPGTRYEYRVKANAKRGDGKMSHRLIAETHWKEENNIQSYSPGFGVQYNRRSQEEGQWDKMHNEDAQAQMFIGGKEVICKVNSDHLYNVQLKGDAAYYELERRRKVSMGFGKADRGRTGIKECQHLIQQGKKYNVIDIVHNEETEKDERKFIFTTVRYLIHNGEPVVCTDKSRDEIMNVPMSYYRMIRMHTKTDQSDDGLQDCSTYK